jgi:O-antigen/teichoic acid export membrane protein
VARVLGPEQLGVLTLPVLVISYLPFVNIGIVDALVRDIPLLRGSGDAQRLQRSIDASATFLLLIIILLALTMIGARSIFPTLLTDNNLLYAFVVASVPIALLHRFIYTLANGYQNFHLISVATISQSLFRAVVVLTLLALLVTHLDLYAQPIAILLSLLMAVIVFWWYLRPRLRFHLSLPLLRHFIATGFPISLYALFLLMLINGDTFVIGHRFSLETLGFYQLGNLVRDTLIMLSGAFASVILPAYAHIYGREGNSEFLRNKVFSHFYYFLLGGSLLTGLSWSALPFLVQWLLPQYLPAVELLQRMALAIFPFMLTLVLTSYLIVCNRQKLLVLFQLLAMVFFFSLDGLLVHGDAQLLRTPVIAFTGYTVYFLVVWLLYRRQSGLSWRFLWTAAAGFLPILLVGAARWILPGSDSLLYQLQVTAVYLVLNLVLIGLLLGPWRPGVVFSLRELRRS